MATSSITHNFVVSNPNSVKRFVAAIDEADRDRTPKQKDIIFAEKVVREIDEKKAQGIGVFTVDGKMIDIAFYDGAKRTIALAKASGVYKGDLTSSSKKTPTSKVGDELRLLPTTNA